MIYVFKTSVKSRQDINRLNPYLSKIIGPSNWNFDLDDCDKVLRIDSENDYKSEIIALLRNFNFDCDELTD